MYEYWKIESNFLRDYFVDYSIFLMQSQILAIRRYYCTASTEIEKSGNKIAHKTILKPSSDQNKN